MPIQSKHSLLPFAFLQSPPPDLESKLILAADVGGTNAKFALCRMQNGRVDLEEEKIYPSKDYQLFEDIISQFLADTKAKPDVYSIGIAGPVQRGRAKATNLPWSVDCEELAKVLGSDNVSVLNDLEAHTYGLSVLPEDEFLLINAGDPEMGGNAAMIAAGTGLGEAGIYWDGQFFHPFASEGGHSSFGPRTEQDIRLLKYLTKKFGRVSWERVVSGPGICNIFSFLNEVENRPISDELKNAIRENSSPKVISEYAAKGEPICRETLDMFVRYYAWEAANLCLKIKATGGLFIGGGIADDLITTETADEYMEYFLDAGRMGDLLKNIPIRVIINEKTAVMGAAFYGAYVTAHQR